MCASLLELDGQEVVVEEDVETTVDHDGDEQKVAGHQVQVRTQNSRGLNVDVEEVEWLLVEVLVLWPNSVEWGNGEPFQRKWVQFGPKKWRRRLLVVLCFC